MRRGAEVGLAKRELAQWFQRNGHVRRQNAARVAAEGFGLYKKGDEVRLMARSASELEAMRRLLRQAGFKPGRPFAKGRQLCQPIYGRQQVARFLQLVAEVDGVAPNKSRKRTALARRRLAP
jgi:hypothetical protein